MQAADLWPAPPSGPSGADWLPAAGADGGASNAAAAAAAGSNSNANANNSNYISQPVELNALQAAQHGYFRYSPIVSVIIALAYTLVFIVGLVGNSFVVAIVCKSPRMRTVTNYFIANLALADILVLLFCLPATLVGNLFVPWVLGLFVCKTVSYLQGVAVSASIYTMVAVTIDRFLAICFPMDWHMSRRAARRVIACIWLFSLSICLPWALYFTLLPYSIDNQNIVVCHELWPSERMGMVYFVCADLILLYVLPGVLILSCYLGIWYKIQARAIPGDRPHGLNIELIMQKSKLKVVKMMMVVVIIFLLSWLPVYLMFARVKLVDERSAWEDWFITKMMPLAQWLGASNSCINPILYTFFNRKYKQGFVDLLRFAFCCRPVALASAASQVVAGARPAHNHKNYQCHQYHQKQPNHALGAPQASLENHKGQHLSGCGAGASAGGRPHNQHQRPHNERRRRRCGAPAPVGWRASGGGSSGGGGDGGGGELSSAASCGDPPGGSRAWSPNGARRLAGRCPQHQQRRTQQNQLLYKQLVQLHAPPTSGCARHGPGARTRKRLASEPPAATSGAGGQQQLKLHTGAHATGQSPLAGPGASQSSRSCCHCCCVGAPAAPGPLGARRLSASDVRGQRQAGADVDAGRQLPAQPGELPSQPARPGDVAGRHEHALRRPAAGCQRHSGSAPPGRRRIGGCLSAAASDVHQQQQQQQQRQSRPGRAPSVRHEPAETGATAATEVTSLSSSPTRLWAEASLTAAKQVGGAQEGFDRSEDRRCRHDHDGPADDHEHRRRHVQAESASNRRHGLRLDRNLLFGSNSEEDDDDDDDDDGDLQLQHDGDVETGPRGARLEHRRRSCSPSKRVAHLGRGLVATGSSLVGVVMHRLNSVRPARQAGAGSPPGDMRAVAAPVPPDGSPANGAAAAPAAVAAVAAASPEEHKHGLAAASTRLEAVT